MMPVALLVFKFLLLPLLVLPSVALVLSKLLSMLVTVSALKVRAMSRRLPLLLKLLFLVLVLASVSLSLKCKDGGVLSAMLML